jgi:hypothetical protein
VKLIVFVLVLVQSLSAFAVREVQNGGGGINTNGELQTFFSANFKFEDEPESPEKIPGLVRLVNEIDKMPIKASVKGLLLSSVYPTFDRRYYRVKGGDVDRYTREGIYREYARLMQVPVSQLVIFAASGPLSKQTVLMKEFYSLKESEQAAIIFHEGLWIMNAGMTYAQVVNLEIDAQAYFEDHNNVKALYRLVTNLGETLSDRTLPLVTALAIDFQSKNFPSPQGSSLRSVKLVDLVGASYLDCMILHDFTNYKTRAGDIDYVRACNQVISRNTVVKATQNPNSYFYQSLLVYMGRAGHVDLLSYDNDMVHLKYVGDEESYEEFRDSIYVNFQEPVAGDRMDLTVYDQRRRSVGRIRF